MFYVRQTNNIKSGAHAKAQTVIGKNQKQLLY